MTNKIILIPTLKVEVVTGDTCYRDEGGFSSISARAVTDDTNLIGTLSGAQDRGDAVTLRCAMLDVTGKITNCISDGGKKIFVMVIDDLTYRRPGN